MVIPFLAQLPEAGAMTMRGRTRSLSFDAAACVQGDGEIWLDAEVGVNRADFGLTWNRWA